MLLLPALSATTTPFGAEGSACRNPLFIGNAFATLAQAKDTQPPLTVAIPYSSGMLLLLAARDTDGNWAAVAIPYSSGMLLLQGLSSNNVEQIPKEKGSQSPIHRECFCYSEDIVCSTEVIIDDSRNPLFIGNAFATEWLKADVAFYKGVAIPYSSGMLLLPPPVDRRRAVSIPLFVAIPYSSGMLLLRDPVTGAGANGHQGSQSPIHRECFCYSNTVPPGSMTPPLSQSPIHRECFCYS